MKTRFLPVSEASLAEAKELIAAGEVVAFHTETVYGLGADARNDAAVKKIFALKGRPADNPLIAHVHTGYDISALVEIPSYAYALQQAFLPGPLTMVYPSKGKVSRYVSCGLPTLSLRVPSSPAAQQEGGASGGADGGSGGNGADVFDASRTMLFSAGKAGELLTPEETLAFNLAEAKTDFAYGDVKVTENGKEVTYKEG